MKPANCRVSAVESRLFSDGSGTSYNVTFPLSEKIDVNGTPQHPVYKAITGTADSSGHSGDIRWNFEKFVIDRNGSVVARFAPTVAPDDPSVLEAIDRALA